MVLGPVPAKLPPEKIRSLVTSLFQVVPDRGNVDELVFICEEPGCGDQSGNRSVNLRTGKTGCWRCGKGGNLITWLQHLGHDPDVDNLELYDQTGLDDDLTETLETPTVRRVIAVISDVKLPRGFTPLAEEPDGCYARLVEKMAIRKHLNLETFIRAGAGFTRDDSRWEPYCIFPVYEYDKVVYFQGRTYTDPKEGATKLFPSRRECPLGSRHWVYNIDRLRQSGEVAIAVESMFNVFSLERVLGPDSPEVPVAIFKHKLSSEQQAKILSAKGIKELCLFFDPDALVEAWESCRGLTNLIKVTVADTMPPGVDPNDDAELALECFRNRKPYTAITALDQLVQGL